MGHLLGEIPAIFFNCFGDSSCSCEPDVAIVLA